MPQSGKTTDHNAYQREYFARPERTSSRMAPVQTPYIHRHLARLLAELGTAPGARVVDVGAGMGRFSLPLAERGYRVTAVDLAPELLGVLRDHDPAHRIETICAAAEDLAAAAPGPFEAAVGFFFLHHLRDLRPVAESLAGVLVPGGRMAFCEPNAYCPLFYGQILLTPGMTFRGDGGIARMRPGVLLPAFERAGFRDLRIDRYGLFPPGLANTDLGARVERRLERLAPLRPVLAFQILSGTFCG